MKKPAISFLVILSSFSFSPLQESETVVRVIVQVFLEAGLIIDFVFPHDRKMIFPVTFLPPRFVFARYWAHIRCHSASALLTALAGSPHPLDFVLPTPATQAIQTTWPSLSLDAVRQCCSSPHDRSRYRTVQGPVPYCLVPAA